MITSCVVFFLLFGAEREVCPPVAEAQPEEPKETDHESGLFLLADRMRHVQLTRRSPPIGGRRGARALPAGREP